MGDLRGFRSIRVEQLRCEAAKGAELGLALLDGVRLCAQERLPVLVVHNDREYYLDPEALLEWADGRRRDG